jgi:hypothetical protein
MVCLSCTLASSIAGENEPVTFYVQLVRGTDEEGKPQADSKRIGPKLTSNFERVFRWKYYWEINRHEVKLATGKKCRIKLNPERDVEIDSSNPLKRKVTVFYKGEPLSANIRPVGERMTIAGGDRDARSAWFVVVRRDKPTD